MNELNELVWETAEELDKKLAERIRRIRKRRSISQQELAVMSGVSYGSIKRFMQSGDKNTTDHYPAQTKPVPAPNRVHSIPLPFSRTLSHTVDC